MKQERINEILGFGYLAIAILVFVSLITYDPNDLGFLTSTPNERLHNFVGIIGAYIGAFLFFLIGKSSYLIPFLYFMWALDRFTMEEPSGKSYIRIAGGVVLFLSTGSLLALVFNATSTDMMNAGGIFGMLISSLLQRYFGAVGSYIIVLTLLILSVLLTTELLIIPFLAAVFAKTKEGMIKSKRGPVIIESARPKIRVEKEVVSKPLPKPVIQEKPRPEITVPHINIKTSPIEKIPKAAKEEKLKPVKAESKVMGEYRLPPLDLLDSPPPVEERKIKEDLTALSAILEDTLRDFGIEVKVAQVEKGLPLSQRISSPRLSMMRWHLPF